MAQTKWIPLAPGLLSLLFLLFLPSGAIGISRSQVKPENERMATVCFLSLLFHFLYNFHGVQGNYQLFVGGNHKYFHF